MPPLQTIQVAHPNLEGSYVARATVPLRGSLSPGLVVSQGGAPCPTQSRLVASTDTWKVVELAALVSPAASSDLEVELGTAPAVGGGVPFEDFDDELVRLVSSRRIRWRTVGRGGEAHVYDAQADAFMTWQGPLALRWRTYARTPVGSLVAFWGLDAHARAITASILWTNGDLPAAPDRLLRAIELLVPDGFTWSPLLPDPASRPPALLAHGAHAILSRGERLFRVAIHRSSDAPPELFQGLGLADWTGGGYLPQGFHAPEPPATGDLGLRLELHQEEERLRNAWPTAPGERPPAPAWPVRGVPYGGMTSGLWIEQAPGLRTASTRSADGVRLAAVEAVGWRARHPGNLYPGGRPILPEEHLRPDGSAPWRMFDLRFERSGGIVQDEPFRYSALPDLTPDELLWCPYLDELRGWAPNDSQHLIRALRSNLELAWLAGDELACFQLAGDAAMSRMQLWPGAGAARRLPAPPSPGGEGGSFGRGEAWAAVVVAADMALTSEPRRRNANRAWLEAWVDYVDAAQLPTGLCSVATSGKVFTDPPFSSQYLVHRSNEQVYLAQALVAAWRAGIAQALPPAKALLDGLWLFASRPGTGGLLERYPAGPVGGPLYRHQGEIPRELLDAIGLDAYQNGSIGALAALALPPHAGWQIPDFAGVSTLREARSTFRAWGRSAPSSRSGALFETWGATLGALDTYLRR